MAYHKNKFERDYDIIVDVFGADHLDAYPDVVGVCKVLGYDSSNIKVSGSNNLDLFLFSI